MSVGWLAVPIRGKSVNDRSTEMRVNFKTIGGAQENVIKVIHRHRQLCKDFIIVNGVIAKLKTNSCKPTLNWTIKLKNTFVFRSFDLKKKMLTTSIPSKKRTLYGCQALEHCVKTT